MQDLTAAATPAATTPAAAAVADPATGFTPADLRRAALSVCAYAADAAEARELLEALGLVDDLRAVQAIAS